MPITALPPAPQRSDPTTFADRGDMLMAALPGFVTEANALQTDVTAKQVIASDAATTATAAALNAQAWANAVKWVSGTTYAPGDVRWSPITFASYRRKTAGAGTTDPSADGTNWLAVVLSTPLYAYDSRAALRTLSPAAGDLALVQDLGLFVWQSGPLVDNDETCFNTASGAWTMTAASPDYVHAAIVNDTFSVDELRQQSDNALSTVGTNLASLTTRTTALETKVLTGFFTMSLTALMPVTAADFTCTVTGAGTTDRVLVTPGDSFGTSDADRAAVHYVARVSAANTVTVSIRNASASLSNFTASTWLVTVFKP